MGSMNIHQISHGLPAWEQESSLLTLSFKRLRPLAPKLDGGNNDTITAFDLKNFIRPESGHIELCLTEDNRDSPQVETHPGGTRWNPTQEQIRILEMLYRGGVRTPNAQQIEQITAQLGKYGKIEGKNVFYWFQNHKARERQKQKRNSLGRSHGSRSVPFAPADNNLLSLDIGVDVEREENSTYKRKCRSWSFGCLEIESSSMYLSCREDNRTLELFPLHPEGR